MSQQSLTALEAHGIKIVEPLTKIESKLLDVLTSRKGEVVPRSEIETLVYKGDTPPASNCIEAFIGRLRKKLSDPTIIRTARGRGYEFVYRKEVTPIPQAAEATQPAPDTVKEKPPCS